MINWRNLFDDIRVPYYDRGPNTARGHLSVKCPWCGNADPSHHLAINEETGQYRCYRAPTQHAGRSPFHLLRALNVPAASLDGLLRKHGYSSAAHIQKTERRKEAVVWDRFVPAESSPRAIDYLEQRGFYRPVTTAKQFDLRVAEGGRYAMRLLFPFVWDEYVIGFTGRTMRADLEPKYLSNDPTEGALYIPRPPADDDTLIIALEGPFDALKGAATIASGIAFVALTGLALTRVRMQRIVRLSQGKMFVLALDADQPSVLANRMLRELRGYIPNTARAALPHGRKDLGEAQFGEISEWSRKLIDLYGPEARSRDGHAITSNLTTGA